MGLGRPGCEAARRCSEGERAETVTPTGRVGGSSSPSRWLRFTPKAIAIEDLTTPAPAPALVRLNAFASIEGTAFTGPALCGLHPRCGHHLPAVPLTVDTTKELSARRHAGPRPRCTSAGSIALTSSASRGSRRIRKHPRRTHHTVAVGVLPRDVGPFHLSGSAEQSEAEWWRGWGSCLL